MGLNVRKKISSAEFESYLGVIQSKVGRIDLVPQELLLAAGDLTVKIYSSSEVLREFIRKEFYFVLAQGLDDCDFRLITGNFDIQSFLKPIGYEEAGKIEFICDGFGVISIDYDNNVLLAYDDQSNSSFLLTNNLSDLKFILRQGHLFVHIINHWACKKGLILLHCAAVADAQSGALICGRGGRGKSTLAIASLIRGFNYVSDDYLLCRPLGLGVVEVYPIYSIVTMSEEIFAKMHGFDGEYIGISPWTGKKVYSISKYKDRVIEGLRVDKVIFPNICHADEPSIKPCEPQQPISHIVTSTLSQLYGGLKVDQVPILMKALSGLTYYGFDLTSDIFKNSEYLRKFLRESI